MLYAALHDSVFGFQAIRAPARFVVIAMLGLATLAGLGVRELASRTPRSRMGRLVPLLVTAAACVEWLNAPLPLVPAPSRQTAVDNGSRVSQQQVRSFTCPCRSTSRIPCSWCSRSNRPPHRQRLQRPAGRRSSRRWSRAWPSCRPPTALMMLRDFDVRFVVSPATLAGAGEPASPLVERARLDGGIVYELRWTPAAIEAVDAAASSGTPPPPLAGPAANRHAGNRRV